jgi:hypothetical protein
MEQQASRVRKQRWLPLPTRIAIGYVFAAVIPLILVLVFIWSQTRPTLIDQASNTMTSDAQTRVQLIDNYFKERQLDDQTLAQVPSVQTFLLLDPASPAYRDGFLHAGFALQAGQARDKNYTNWTLFSIKGGVIQSYPAAPPKHGKTYFTAAQLKDVTAGNTFISPVFYDPQKKQATVDIYAPIFAPALPGTKSPEIGFIRSTLKLDYIWQQVVGPDTNTIGKGSTAFILDNNGVRVADNNPAQLFTSVAPLDADTQQQITDEQRYGDQSQVGVDPDPAVFTHNQAKDTSEIFDAQLDGQKDQFQIARHAATAVPWQYYVVSPVNTVTDIANKQMISIIALACIASLIVAIGGFVAGKGITRPILRAVEYLLSSSQSLSALAEGQQEAASEQVWVVDSSQVGLQSIQYYTDAAIMATSNLQTIANGLQQHWDMIPPQQADQTLSTVVRASQYLENAMELQNASNQKLATALKVATQVTEQFHLGATSATQAAEKLEEVVQDLRSVVGKSS